MQIATKYIADNAVSAPKIRLANAAFLRGRNAANSGDINMWEVNGTDQVQAGAAVNMGAFQIKNVAAPSVGSDVSTKDYTDSVAAGLAPKEAADAATAAALAANTYNNGASGVGATITADGNGALIVDGYTVENGDRVLVKDEVGADAPNNGIYVVTDKGSAGTPFILTRSLDADSSSDLKGANLFVLNGTVNTKTEWVLITPSGTIVIGTDDILFSPFGNAFSAGNGIDITGSTISVKLLANSGLGFSGTSLTAKVQGAGTTNTTAFDGSGNIKALKAAKETFTLGAGDITNQYVDLAVVAHTGSIFLQPVGAMVQQEGQDYSVSYTGGSGGVTRVTFLNGLATGGASALVATDVLMINYQTL